MTDLDLIERDRKRQQIRDNRVACSLLYKAGASEDEVDDILTDYPVPIDPDMTWATETYTDYWQRRKA